MSDFDELVRHTHDGLVEASPDVKLLSAGSDQPHEHHWRFRTRGGEVLTIRVEQELCEVANPHHPECECPVCRRHEDEACANFAVATTQEGVRVCAAHADAWEADGFPVTRDR